MDKPLLSRSSDTVESDFIWDKFLQKGAYGQVHKVTSKSTKRTFAIKKIDKAKLFSQNMGSQIANEVKIMYSIRHPNIVKIFDSFESERHLFIVLEYMEMGSLFIELRKKKKLDELSARKCLREIVDAVGYLHSMTPPILHRDIKPENVLVDGKGACKLADFGWSNLAGILRITYCGTAPYLAPEMIEKTGHNQTLDYWCLGVLTYELLTGFVPFDNGRGDTQQRNLLLKNNILNVKYQFPRGISDVAKDFISRLLRKNPSQRMNIEQMKCHDFIVGKPVIRQMSSAQIDEEEGESEDTESLREDPFAVLTLKLNRSEEENRMLKEELFYLSEEVKRIKVEAEVGVSSSRALQEAVEELKGKLRGEQMENTRLQQRATDLMKRVESQSSYQQQLEGEVEQLEKTNRELRKTKDSESKLTVETYFRPSLMPIRQTLEAPSPTLSRRSSASPVDSELKTKILEEFSEILKLHLHLKERIEESERKEKEKQNLALENPEDIFEARLQQIRAQYDQKACQQFLYYNSQLQKLNHEGPLTPQS